MDNADLLRLTAGIVSAHVGANRVGTEEVSVLVREVHGALAQLCEEAEAPARAVPAVSVQGDRDALPLPPDASLAAPGSPERRRALARRMRRPRRHRGG